MTTMQDKTSQLLPCHEDIQRESDTLHVDLMILWQLTRQDVFFGRGDIVTVQVTSNSIYCSYKYISTVNYTKT